MISPLNQFGVTLALAIFVELVLGLLQLLDLLDDSPILMMRYVNPIIVLCTLYL